MMERNEALSQRMQQVVEEERRQSAEDRQQLLSQISNLINAQAEIQESRLAEKTALLQKSVLDSNTTLEGSVARYGEAMDTWDKKEGTLLEDVKKSRDAVKTTLKDDWNVSLGSEFRTTGMATNDCRLPTTSAPPSEQQQSRYTPRLSVWLTSRWPIWTSK